MKWKKINTHTGGPGLGVQSEQRDPWERRMIGWKIKNRNPTVPSTRRPNGQRVGKDGRVRPCGRSIDQYGVRGCRRGRHFLRCGKHTRGPGSQTAFRDRRLAAVERMSRREMGVQGKRASERRRRVQGCVDGKNVTPPHNGGRWVDGKKALHNPAHRCAAGNRWFCLPYAFGNAGDRCGDVQRVLNAYFAGERTALVHYSRTFETEKRVRRWRRDRLCGHFDGRGGMTSPRARRRFGSPSLSHPRGVSLVFVRPQRHRTVTV